MTATAFIPARKGSKGLPGKNRKLFHGKPLIQWSIDQAKETKIFDKIVVSSDDERVLQIADEAGVVAVKRQPELATDSAIISAVIFDYFARPENRCDYVCLLNPTSPLRTASDISAMFRFVKMKKYQAVISVKWDDIIGWVEKPTNQGPLPMYNLEARPNRQTRDDFYLENGSIYWCKHEVILAYGNFIGNPLKVKLYEMPKERSLEIDTPFDFFMCERAYEYSSMEK